MFSYPDIKRAVSRTMRDDTGTYDEDIHEYYRNAYWEIKSSQTTLSPQREVGFSTVINQDIYTHDEHGRPFLGLGVIDYAFLEFPGSAQVRFPLRRIEAEDALIWRSVPSQPYYFDLFDGSIRLFPQPDRVYRVKLTVSQTLPTDSDEVFSAQFSDDFRQAFTLYVLFKLTANITMENDRAKSYLAQFNQEMQRLHNIFTNRLSTGRIRGTGLSRGFHHETY